MTPLEAREPYIAVAEASFSTSMLTISLGFIDARGLEFPSSEPEESIITPSITKIGWDVALRELVPRIRIVVLPPGVPVFACICTPAALPCNTWSTLVGTDFSIALELTETTEPVRSERFICP